MADIKLKEVRDNTRISVKKDLSDVGLYCYSSLCAIALNKLFSDDPNNRLYIENFIKMLAKHLEQQDCATESILIMATDSDFDDSSTCVKQLKEESIVKKEGPVVITRDLVLLGLSDGCYDSRTRTLIKFIALTLKVPWDEIEEYENLVVEMFVEGAHQLTEEEQAEKKHHETNRKIKKYAMLATATVAGGVLLGVTGGLAAPFIAAGAGVLIGTAGAAALGSVAGVAIIGSLFGVAGAGLGAYKMKKRVGDVEEFAFHPICQGQGSQLHLSVAVSGWLTEACPDFVTPWQGLANSKEQFSLRYESKYLQQLGSAMNYFVNMAVSSATSEALKFTILAGVLEAIAWPAAILSAANILDNPWNVMTNRSVAVGRQLAEVLLSRQQGQRPVTLFGYSLGARVIFYCLQEMATRKNSEGIVEDVVLLGAPVTSSSHEWAKLKRVVSGQIVNGYCRGDWLLKFLYRTVSVQLSIAGLQPVMWVDRRMHNIDLSDVVNGHMDYQVNLDLILHIIGIKVQDHADHYQTANSLEQWVNINKHLRAAQVRASQSAEPVNPGSEEGAQKTLVVNSNGNELHSQTAEEIDKEDRDGQKEKDEAEEERDRQKEKDEAEEERDRQEKDEAEAIVRSVVSEIVLEAIEKEEGIEKGGHEVGGATGPTTKET